MKLSDRICQNAACGKRFESKRKARFCSDRCRYEAWDAEHPRVDAGSRTTDSAHPLAAARVQQEASELNASLGHLVRQAIVHQLETTGRVHADDLEPHFPAEHVKRCRRLTGAQFGQLASRHYILGVEYRKSTVPERKGAKSWVYVFTDLGRQKLVGVAADSSSSSSNPLAPPLGIGVEPLCSGDPGERSTGGRGESVPDNRGLSPDRDRAASPAANATSDPASPEPLALLPDTAGLGRPLNPLTDAEAA